MQPGAIRAFFCAVAVGVSHRDAAAQSKLDESLKGGVLAKK